MAFLLPHYHYNLNNSRDEISKALKPRNHLFLEMLKCSSMSRIDPFQCLSLLNKETGKVDRKSMMLIDDTTLNGKHRLDTMRV